MISKKRGRNLLFRNKKAISNELFFNVFELVLAAIVILALYNFINSVVDSTIFEKNYLARDLAMLTNTVYSSPGDLSYIYSENSGKHMFIFDFKHNSVQVTDKSSAGLSSSIPGKENTDSTLPASYPFAENKNLAFGPVIVDGDEGLIKIGFIKSEGGVNVYNPVDYAAVTLDSKK
ncbi:MAG: hypothetical protein AABX32_07515 [Nanoarchaeota archaeon]